MTTPLPSKSFHPHLIWRPCNRIVTLDGALDGGAVAHHHRGVLDGHGEGGRNCEKSKDPM